MADPVGGPGPKAGVDSGASGAPSGSDPSQPKYITAEELDEKLNGAFGKRLGEHSRSLTKQFTELLGKHSDELFGKIGAGIDERLAALKPKDEPAKKTEAPAFKLEDLPEWKQQQEQLKRLQKEAEDGKRQAAEERAKNRAGALRTKAVEAFTEAGIQAGFHKAALAHLITEEGRIGYADGGNGDTIVFRTDGGEELPLLKGLKDWAKTPEGKHFLPAINTGGSGGGPGRPGSGADPNDPRTKLTEGVNRLLNGG